MPPVDGFTPAQLQRLHELIDPLHGRLDQLAAEIERPDVDVLAEYCNEAPSAQTAVDIFEGEWASRLPAPLQDVRAGDAPLFEIEHVPWGVEVLGGVRDQRVGELGPLEGGHAYLLDWMGAREDLSVKFPTAVESEYDGFRHTLHRQEYQVALQYRGSAGARR